MLEETEGILGTDRRDRHTQRSRQQHQRHSWLVQTLRLLPVRLVRRRIEPGGLSVLRNERCRFYAEGRRYLTDGLWMDLGNASAFDAAYRAAIQTSFFGEVSFRQESCLEIR